MTATNKFESGKPQNINLLTDFGFKRFFGTEQYKKNLIHFLNTFLGQYIGPVKDIRYLPTEQLGLRESEKRLVFDVFCERNEDEKIIVEMQKADQEFLKNRIVAYSSRIISSALESGDLEYRYPKVISIVLADFKILELKNSDKFIQHVMLKDDGNNIFLDKMSFLLIDLSKFAGQKEFVQYADDKEKWCYTIKNMWQMRETDIPKRYGIFHELFEECNISKLNAMEKQDYEKSVLEYEDVKDAMKYHRKLGMDEGFEKGMEKGMKKGMEKGLEKGREEGIKALLKTAANLLKMGMAPADIAKATGLTEEQLAEILP
ncbi:MAG: Rpn family recombination-promoting nuclease/putative transposase [Bacteroidales bacterium]|nr:Rpn family recombination-promoting nuclease/putative transposase [Bacteroidales bacterium]